MDITYAVPFTQIANNIIQNTNLSVYEKMIYIVLCSHANQNKGCFPSYKTIATEACCSERQAKIIIKQLENKGYILVTRRKNKKGKNQSNIYEIVTVGASDAQGGECPALPDSESPAQGGASGAHELYESKNTKSFYNMHLSISEQEEIDGIIEKLELDIFDNKTDSELFEEVIRRMYAAPYIKVYGVDQPQLAVRKRLRKLSLEIVCSAFDKYQKQLPKNPLNFLTSLLYNEMCQAEAFDLQCQRTEVF